MCEDVASSAEPPRIQMLSRGLLQAVVFSQSEAFVGLCSVNHSLSLCQCFIRNVSELKITLAILPCKHLDSWEWHLNIFSHKCSLMTFSFLVLETVAKLSFCYQCTQFFLFSPRGKIHIHQHPAVRGISESEVTVLAKYRVWNMDFNEQRLVCRPDYSSTSNSIPSTCLFLLFLWHASMFVV